MTKYQVWQVGDEINTWQTNAYDAASAVCQWAEWADNLPPNSHRIAHGIELVAKVRSSDGVEEYEMIVSGECDPHYSARLNRPK